MRSTRIITWATAALVAGGAIVFSDGVAQAAPIKESTIKSECADAGGTYSTVVKGSFRYSTCSYQDIDGNGYTDYYLNGSYYSTRPQ